MKVLFIVFCVYVGSLFFRQERLPKAFVSTICGWLSTDDVKVSAKEISYGFLHGIRFERVRVFNTKRENPLEPIFSAEQIEVRPFMRRVRIVAAKLPRLHDGYYDDNSVAEPLGENDGRYAFRDLPDFRLELVRPEILGVSPLKVEADVRLDRSCLEFRGINLLWPDVDDQMSVGGFCAIDLAAMRVYGQCEGLAKQANIRSMFGDRVEKTALDLPVVLPYIDNFTEVPTPVPASCAWDANLVNNEFTINVRMRPELGRYNGVSLKDASGGVAVHVWWRNKQMQYETSVDLDSAHDRFGRTVGGHLSVICTNGVRTVRMAVASELRKDDALDVLGYLNDGLLDSFECVTPPHVTVGGVLATRIEDQRLNDVHGDLSCRDAKLFDGSVSNVVSHFDYVGDTFSFTGISLDTSRGGHITGDVLMRLPGLDASKASYECDLRCEHGSILDLTDALDVDPGKRHGKVDAEVRLSGMLATNRLETLNGEVHFRIKDGYLNQMRMFMGLTDLLADKVPGVSAVVNQSDASGDFTITDGVIHTDNLRIEGSLFSISAEGDYNSANDNLDFVVQVRFMKDDSVPGVKELVRVLSWPFSKLLMEFRVTGPLKEPKWSYVSILDRVM